MRGKTINQSGEGWMAFLGSVLQVHDGLGGGDVSTQSQVSQSSPHSEISVCS